MSEQQAERFVVLSTLVNDWPRGTVIGRDQLKTYDRDHPDKVVHDAHDHLIGAGAIRPLRESEAGLAHVPAPAGGLSPETQLKLGQLDATIEHLTRTVAALQDRLAFHQAAGSGPAAPPPEEDPAVAAAIAQRQARVDHLTATLEAMQKQLGEAEGQTRQAGEARAQAAQEARGGRDMPTGQATPTGHTEDPASAGGGTPSPPPPPQPGPGVTTGAPAPAFPPPEEARPRRGRRGGSGEEE
jgi:hypothetical protein